MSALLDSLAAGCDGDDARRQALDDVLRDGLPHARVEAWKYTPLRALERRSFAAVTAAAIDAALVASNQTTPARSYLGGSRLGHACERALQIADRAYVLETGSITLSGTGAELASSDAVKKAYLGG